MQYLFYIHDSHIGERNYHLNTCDLDVKKCLNALTFKEIVPSIRTPLYGKLYNSQNNIWL